MKFLGGFWRLLVGVKDALVLMAMLLFFGALAAALNASPKRQIGDGALALDLAGVLVEQPAAVDPLATFGNGAQLREHRLADLVRALDRAAGDKRIKAVTLELDGFMGGGQVTIQTLGDAIDRFRKQSGKPVLAHATVYSDDSYALAAHASEIWLDPMGGAAFAGPGGSRLYYKGLLDRLGVTAHVYRVGTYKSAVEPYVRSDMSPEARAAAQALADALWEGWQRDVAAARPKAKLAAAIADPAGNGDFARTALAQGLVDRLGDAQAFARRVAEVAGEDKKSRGYRKVRLADWIAAHPPATGDARIGIVTVAGEIRDGDHGPGVAGGDTIARAIRKGLARGDLKALVVRIDSPGGSAIASEQIRLALVEAKQAGLPVIVSMGSVAASGGYWVATAGDRIFAEPDTITGSIGVFGVLPTFEQTLAKIGVSADGVRTTALSGQPDLFRGTSPVFDRMAQAGVESVYRRFVALVAASRRLTPARVDEIGQGRVWHGGTARQIGLVDAFGGLDAAIAEAARRAKIDAGKAGIVYLEKQPEWFERLIADAMQPSDDGSGDMTGFGAGIGAGGSRDILGRIHARQQALALTALDDARRLAGGAAIQARCLDCAAMLPPRPVNATGMMAAFAAWLGR
jgi:protease-4